MQGNKTKDGSRKPVTHWRSKVTVNIMEDKIAFERLAIPAEIYRYLK